MISIANQKRFIGLTVSCLATIIPLSMLGNGIVLGQTDDQQAKMLAENLKATNIDRDLFLNTNPLSAAAAGDALNTGSQSCAQKLLSAHSLDHELCKGDRNGKGENLFVTYVDPSTNLSPEEVARQAVAAWYSEKANYNYDKPGFSGSTGHFTQLIWADTTTLGCGYAVGTETLDGNVYNAYYVACRYDPAGNVGGESQFKNNVNPPK